MKKAGIAFFIIILIITGVLRVNYCLQPVSPYSDKKVEVMIKPGTTGREIANSLYQRDLIRNPWIFSLVLTLYNLDGQLQAGYYEFERSQGLMEIIGDLQKGRVAEFKLTVPEGFTVEEIARRLASKTDYNYRDYLKAARSSYYEYEFLPSPEGENRYRLEGFLYPSTYNIPKGFNPVEIYQLILENYQEEWWSQLKREKADSRYSPFTIMIIASLIEKEAKINKEKPIIAGVIYNRLEKEMRLQIDATVQYVLKSRKQRISYSDVNVSSPYNTYENPGLPPGPICNPGAEAIKAALEPAQVEYYFYFALNNGTHVFTETYQKHLQLQLEMQKKGLIDE